MNKQRFTIYGNADDLDGIQKAIDLVKENEKLQNRINKAIEYIEKHSNSFSVLDTISNAELIKILKGRDKE